MSSKSSYYLPGSSDIKNLPEPTWVCEDCGGGSWKKIKKGSDVEKYLKFCRCDAEPDAIDTIVEEPVKPLPVPEESEESEEAEEAGEDDEAAEEDDAEKPPEIPKHLRSRLKPKHHVPRKWNHEASFISED